MTTTCRESVRNRQKQISLRNVRCDRWNLGGPERDTEHHDEYGQPRRLDRGRSGSPGCSGTAAGSPCVTDFCDFCDFCDFADFTDFTDFTHFTGVAAELPTSRRPELPAAAATGAARPHS
jgi:hypothetical protein